MKQKLSKAAVYNAKPKTKGDAFYWDTEQLGLGLRVTPTGVRSFVFSYSLAGWRSPRRLTIGRIDGYTLDQARFEARRLREQVLLGIDPAAVVEQENELPTVDDLIERFLTDHAEPKLKPTTFRAYRQKLRALPAWFRRLKVAAVTSENVARLHTSMRSRPYMANRVVAGLRKMFGLAERWQMRPKGSNPAAGHDPYPERKDRGSRLSDDELKRVGQVLAELEAEGRFDLFAFAMLRLNMLTGLRPIEVRTLRWADVDLERRVITLREAKTGTRSGFLGQSAAEILARLPRFEDNPYCFPGRIENQPVQDNGRLWDEIRERAQLGPRLRLYDLVRHTFNTVAQEVGVPPELVKVLVGHVPQTISARYTHYALAIMHAAADRASLAMLERIEGRPSARSVLEPEAVFAHFPMAQSGRGISAHPSASPLWLPLN